MKNTLAIGLLTLGSFFVKAESTPPNESCGKVLNLNGSWDHIVMNPIADSLVSIDDNDKFTVEFWMKTTASTGNIFSLYTNTEFVSYRMYVRMDGGKVGTSETFTSLFTESSAPVNDDQWQHVAVSFNGDIIKLYVDGVYLDSDDSYFFFQNNTRVSVGMTDVPSTGKQEFFKGQIDELRIWSSVKTEEQINVGMNSKSIGDETDLLAYFDFDEGNNSEEVHNNSPHTFDFKITADELKNTRLNPDGSQPTKIEDVTITNPTCFERKDGVMEVNVLSEVASIEYSFSIEPGFSDVNTSTGLGHGTHQTVIRDSEGCYDSVNVDLDDGGTFEVEVEFNEEFEFFNGDIEPSSRVGTNRWINCDTEEIVQEGASTRFYPSTDAYYKMVYVRNETCTFESECLPFGAANIKEKDLSNQFEVYPNPTNGIINISSNLEGGLVNIFNLTGSIVKSVSLTIESVTSLDLNNLKSGVYFIEVAKNGETGVQKFIKK